MYKFALVIFYTILSQNFHFCHFRAMNCRFVYLIHYITGHLEAVAVISIFSSVGWASSTGWT